MDMRQNLIECQRRIWQGVGSKNHLVGPLAHILLGMDLLVGKPSDDNTWAAEGHIGAQAQPGTYACRGAIIWAVASGGALWGASGTQSDGGDNNSRGVELGGRAAAPEPNDL